MTTSRRTLLVAMALASGVLIAMPSAAHAQSKADQKFPDVLSAKVTPRGSDVFDFDVTLSSPYDTPQRYADAFRVMAGDGTVYGERILWHDHADEQPFTRDLHGVRIPSGQKSVVVQGRDKANGYGGKTIEVALPGR